MAFTVFYRGLSRALTQSQLQQAPDSLLAQLFQCAEEGGNGKHVLVLSSEAREDFSNHWQDGSEDLFKASFEKEKTMSPRNPLGARLRRSRTSLEF